MRTPRVVGAVRLGSVNPVFERPQADDVLGRFDAHTYLVAIRRLRRPWTVELEKLDGLLAKSKQAVITQAITGLGGAVKSQLAAKLRARTRRPLRRRGVDHDPPHRPADRGPDPDRRIRTAGPWPQQRLQHDDVDEAAVVRSSMTWARRHPASA